MVVHTIGAEEAARHPALASDLEFEPLLRGAAPEHLLALEAERAAAAVRGGGFAFATERALVIVRDRPWDTGHFGLRCADLERLYAPPGAALSEEVALLDAAVAEARARGVVLLSARLHARQRGALGHLLGREGFVLVDTSVEIGGAVAGAPPGATREATATDLPALRAIAATFTDNRFHRDPRIPRARARAVYTRWVESALASAPPAGVVVAEDDRGRVAGFATCGPGPRGLPVGRVGLVAVRPDARGRGLLRRLLHGVARRLAQPTLVTGTQLTNGRALRGFGRAGLLPYAARHVLHGWLACGEAAGPD